MPFKAGFYYSLHEGGKTNQKPVILIHGAGSSHLMWPVELRRLTGHNVIALDLPGHGHSEGVGCQSISDYTAAITEFLASQGIFQAAFVGYSMGGAIALQLALDFPQHVIGIGVLSTAANINIPPELTAYLGSPATTPAGLQWLKDRLAGPGMPTAAQSAGIKSLTCSRPSVLYNDWLACSRFDLSAQIARINTPAYVACGTADRLTPSAQSQFLSSVLPIARLDVIQGAGHLLPMEQPQRLADGLSRFLDDLLAWHARFPIRTAFPTAVEKGNALRPDKKFKGL